MSYSVTDRFQNWYIRLRKSFNNMSLKERNQFGLVPRLSDACFMMVEYLEDAYEIPNKRKKQELIALSISKSNLIIRCLKMLRMSKEISLSFFRELDTEMTAIRGELIKLKLSLK